MTFQYKPGLGLVAAYQVSGKPYVTGNVNPAVTAVVGFPSVTSWVVVSNVAGGDGRIAFSADGLTAAHSNYLTIKSGSISPRLELKLTELHLGGTSTSMDIMAGLTYIETVEIDNVALSPSGSNWSGSLGALVTTP